jgi:AAA15 family ATPase/GTPase
MALSRISLENFTVFDKIDIELCEGINVFIGENGTGKTHLLKCLYAFCEFATNEKGEPDPILSYAEIVKGCFQKPSVDELAHNFKNIDIVRDESPIKLAVYENNDNLPYELSLSSIFTPAGGTHSTHSYREKIKVSAVFIPAKEMLTHSRLEKDFSQRNLPFDKTLIDILNKTGVSTLRNLPDEMRSVLAKIAEIVGGTVVYDNNQYHIEKKDGMRINFALEAEGFKKLGLIYRLIETGNIQKGSILFWDEPEANLNPTLMSSLVDMIIELERAGIQMFFATHDYMFAKQLEIRREAKDIALFHSLYKDNESIAVESKNSFKDLSHNPISEAYNKLLDDVFEHQARG